MNPARRKAGFLLPKTLHLYSIIYKPYAGGWGLVTLDSTTCKLIGDMAQQSTL